MERIGDTVARQLASTGEGEGLALSTLTGVWPEAVGEAVARQAWPLRMGRDGTLHVATASSTWAFELDRLSPDIVKRLAMLAGASAPARLRFRVGPVPEPATPSAVPAESASKSREVSPEATAEATSIASRIDDPELRELVARAARASLSQARSGRRF